MLAFRDYKKKFGGDHVGNPCPYNKQQFTRLAALSFCAKGVRTDHTLGWSKPVNLSAGLNENFIH